ncbi:hypothetical protein [uncultured Brachyspira sp.]|uniref:hypothetical protein n=1 Tax=uncultured Brachyspira sp. TaxID=221953 RepID=UPI0025F5E14C|nr:hypothetical protein [uncultured Brachyspira sp.]
MKDIIIFDNTKENQNIGKIKGSYDDILIGYTTLICQTAIKSKKKTLRCCFGYIVYNQK